MSIIHDIFKEQPESVSLDMRKHQFLEAAGSFDLLAVVKRNPYSTVVGAAAAGAALGAAAPTLRIVSRLVMPLINSSVMPALTALLTRKLNRQIAEAAEASPSAQAVEMPEPACVNVK